MGFLIFLLMVYVFPAIATELRISALEPQWREIRKWPPNDFLQLFDPQAPWLRTSQITSMMNISLRFILTASDDELGLVLRGLASRGIALSIQAQPLTATEACGLATESFGPPHEMEKAADRLKNFGADLRYVLMDEPLYFGHQFIGQPGKIPCRFPLEKLADEAARKMEPILRAFPSLVIGDVEPFGSGTPGNVWANTIADWHHKFATRTGRKIGLFDADIIWDMQGAVENFVIALPILRSQTASIGVIYHGSPRARSNQEWCEQAWQQAQNLEIERGISLDRVAFDSWTDFPRSLLPETRAGTLTHLVLEYAENRAQLGRPVTRTSKTGSYQ